MEEVLLLEDIRNGLIALNRQTSTGATRRELSRLAHILHSLDSSHGPALTALFARRKVCDKLLALIDQAQNPGGGGTDVELGRAALSCLASYAFLGGVQELQASGGFVALVRLMPSSDVTIRSYAAAAMQNATSFVELVDLQELGEHQELLELLAMQPDESISGPAKAVLNNLEQAKRIQTGETQAAEEADGSADESDLGKGVGLTAVPGANWWDGLGKLEKLRPSTREASSTPEDMLDWRSLHEM